MHEPAEPRLHLEDGDALRVGGPGDRLRVEVAAFRSIGAEECDLALAGLAYGKVVVVDQRLELAVGRLPRFHGVDVERRMHRTGEPAPAAATATPAAPGLLLTTGV